jgi:hypothetical protein
VIPDVNGLRPAVEFLKAAPDRAETKAPVTLALVGENHKVGMDNLRGSLLWSTFNKQTKGQRLVVLERGMMVPKHYKIAAEGSQQPFVTEEQMTTLDGAQFHLGATEVGRSVIVAAYIFLCVANGDQSRRNRIMVLFGQNHIDDIVTAMEYFVTHSADFPWVRKRARAYFTMTSTAG